jgi:hypothetical protein
MLLHLNPVVAVGVPSFIRRRSSRSGIGGLSTTETVKDQLLGVLNVLPLNIGLVVLTVDLNLHAENVSLKPAERKNSDLEWKHSTSHPP